MPANPERANEQTEGLHAAVIPNPDVVDAWIAVLYDGTKELRRRESEYDGIGSIAFSRRKARRMLRHEIDLRAHRRKSKEAVQP